MSDFKILDTMFWRTAMIMLGLDVNDTQNANKVRRTYPADGQPTWKIDEDVMFIRLFEKDDSYSRQLDSIYEEENDTIIKKSARTRVWSVQYTAYGPNAHSNINRIKDGVFRQDIKRILAGSSVFLIPDLPPARRAPELFAGQWWERWDLHLSFNELYGMPDEDVGRIEEVAAGIYISEGE